MFGPLVPFIGILIYGAIVRVTLGDQPLPILPLLHTPTVTLSKPKRNGLKINVSKTKSMLIHSSGKIVDGNLTLKIEKSIVEQVRCHKFLTVVISDTLTWVDHIDMVCKKVSHSLNLLHHLSWFLPQPLMLLFLKSYILPL